MDKPTERILDVSWASQCRPMLEILPELMGQPMSVQKLCSRAVFQGIGKSLSRCCSGMTPRYAKLDDDKVDKLSELPGRTSQAKRRDKSRTKPTVHSGGERRQGLFIQDRKSVV